MRRSLAALVLVGLATACAPARVASPPAPELIGAQPVAPPSVPATVAPPGVTPTTGRPTAAATATSAATATGAATDDGPVPDDGAPVGVLTPFDDGDADTATAVVVPADRAANDPANDPDGEVPAADPDGEVPASSAASSSGVSGAALSDAVVSGTGWASFGQSLRGDLIGRGSFTAAAAVVVDGELIRSVAFGDRVPGRPGAAGPDDRFRIASISKPITAIVLLQLVEAGLVGLGQPVGAQLAAAVGLDPTALGPGAERLTAEQLLSHRSGIPSYHARFFGSGVGSCAQVARGALTRPVGTPGGYRYSNMNYCLAGLLIEQVTGQPYEAAVYERLLTPLGISGMRLAGTYDAGPGEVAHFSRPGRNYMEALGGAGGWIASAPDIARIIGSLAPTSTGWRPLSDEMLARMRRVPNGDPLVASAGYGLGLFLFPDGAIGHTGTLEHTHAMVLGRPDGVTWVVLVNGEHPSESSALRRIVDRAFAAGFPDG